jgi:uncharacterized protein
MNPAALFLRQSPFGVVNVSGGFIVCTRCVEALKEQDRRRGLLGRVGLLPGEGLLIMPCDSVHTVGMAFPITALYLDRYGLVLLRRDLQPGAPGLKVMGTHEVLELSESDAGETVSGDLLRWF